MGHRDFGGSVFLGWVPNSTLDSSHIWTSGRLADQSTNGQEGTWRTESHHKKNKLTSLTVVLRYLWPEKCPQNIRGFKEGGALPRRRSQPQTNPSPWPSRVGLDGADGNAGHWWSDTSAFSRVTYLARCVSVVCSSCLWCRLSVPPGDSEQRRIIRITTDRQRWQTVKWK